MNTPVLDMVSRSGLAGKAILILLGLFSLVSWAIIFNRYIYLIVVNRRNYRFTNRFRTIKKLAGFNPETNKTRLSMMESLTNVALTEINRIFNEFKTYNQIPDKIFLIQNHLTIASECLENNMESITYPLEKGVFLLAMISSIAPFLGLLGTVWGIMNSFFEIGKQGSANLPVVAPGIAEALITTIAGLIVAIPALFFFNYFNHCAEKIRMQVEDHKETILICLKQEIINRLFQDSSCF